MIISWPHAYREFVGAEVLGVRMCDISVIIVNYNTAGLLAACLRSVIPPPGLRIEAIVVDNASEDESVDLLTREFPRVKTIINAENQGFAHANNQAMGVSKGKYLYFLNPDTFVRPGAFEAMISFMASHNDVGLAGTRIINPDGSPQPSLERRYPGHKRAAKDLRGLRGDIAWVLGASMIARHHVCQELGGFDERFFLYGEEQDLCLRFRKAGWKIGFISDALVIHWGGQSEQRSTAKDLWQKKLAAELFFYRKHYSRGSSRRIRRANIIHALWRIISLKVTLMFFQDKSVSMSKLDKYHVALKNFYLWEI